MNDNHNQPEICPICRDTLGPNGVTAKGCKCVAQYHPLCLKDVNIINNYGCPMCRTLYRTNYNMPSDHYLQRLTQIHWYYAEQLPPFWFVIIHIIFSIIFCLFITILLCLRNYSCCEHHEKL